MSDCSTSAMEPKKQQRTCGNCSERYFAPKCNRMGWTNFEEIETPDDGDIFADYCPYWKHRDEPDLEERYELLAQVARELYDAAWCAWRLKVGAEELEISNELKDRVAESYLQIEREQLEALGVSVVDVNGKCKR